LEDPCLDGRIRLRWIFRILDEGHGLDWSGSEWGGRRAVVNAAMNLQVP
jgi:hypothetical protein